METPTRRTKVVVLIIVAPLLIKVVFRCEDHTAVAYSFLRPDDQNMKDTHQWKQETQYTSMISAKLIKLTKNESVKSFIKNTNLFNLQF
jgi:hypothetical protein